MKHAHRRGERGEGKVGCLFTLLLLAATIILCVKLVPVYYSYDQLAEAAGDLCGKGASMSPEAIEAGVRAKAKAMGIPELQAKGAVAVAINGDSHAGTCTIHLKYTRKVDFFGAYVFPVEVDKQVMRSYMDSR